MTGGLISMTDEYVANVDTSGGPAPLVEGINAPSARKRNKVVARVGSICLGITTCLSIPILLVAIAIILGCRVVRGVVEEIKGQIRP
jgi:hypothetical protein